MNEAAARHTLLVRAYERAPASAAWSEDDRAWATQAAAQVEGEAASADTFVARRAALAIERLSGREKHVRRLLKSVVWPAWVGWAIPALALVAGFAADSIGAGQRVNLLAPPLLALIAWNLAVYALIAVRGTWGLVDARARGLGPLARLLARVAHVAGAAPRRHGTVPAAAFLGDWTQASATLTAARIGRVLHTAAAAFAVGALAGLYLRGLALEYRAGWESTFLDADAVRALLGTVLGPASTITGIALPEAPAFEALRFSAGPGVNAAPWLHLYAVTVGLVVLLPRLALALGNRWLEAHLAARFPLPLGEPYFRGLTRCAARAAGHRARCPLQHAARAAVRAEPQRAVHAGARRQVDRQRCPGHCLRRRGRGRCRRAGRQGNPAGAAVRARRHARSGEPWRVPRPAGAGGRHGHADRGADRRVRVPPPVRRRRDPARRSARLVAATGRRPPVAGAVRRSRSARHAGRAAGVRCARCDGGHRRMSAGAAQRIALALVSHTNVGKTTLARTLLGRDVGTVRDAPHVTDAAERYPLVDTPEGDALELWDTPGFGDSVRLARRLALRGNALGWFLTEVWDRFRDRPFWSTQQAVRAVLDHADVVLYLVNAAESPFDSGYVGPEMQVLELIGKPVLVLLNQMGPPKPAREEAAQVQAWRAQLAANRQVRGVLALDAFARCWVQEIALFDAVGEVLPAERHAAFGRLAAAWRQRREAGFAQSMRVLAGRLARAAADREPVLDAGLRGRLRELGAALGLGRDSEATPKQAAMAALAARLDADIRTGTDRLIELHGLGGQARDEILTRLADHYALRERVSEGKAALWGGAITGALAGLKADLATGGLTFGGGLLVGGVLGALGAAGLARGYNLVRGTERTEVAWTDQVLDELAASALLAYLAVAHYGRGRGDWTPSEHPAHWHDVVSSVLLEHRAALASIWAQRAGNRAEQELAAALEPQLAQATRAVLARLYPDRRLAPPPGSPQSTPS
jgi:hypothetical protein